MNEDKTLIELLDKKEKLVAMLAPSFPVVFSYPAIITMLKKLGFSYVVEVAVGAEKTNEELISLLHENPDKRYITSPCPTVVRMIKNTMPQYANYFGHGVDSPMAATAKIVRSTYPGYKPVFIGPCVMKKLEAKEDVPELDILVVTYAELSGVFTHFNIKETSNPDDRFDLSEPGLTKMYAMDGGLSRSSGLASRLKPGQLKVSSGAANRKTIEEFDADPTVKLLDILNCPGGCIFGPGIQSTLTLEERKQRIHDYMIKTGGIPFTEL